MAPQAADLISLLEGVDKTSFANETERSTIKTALATALAHIQTPFETAETLGWQRLLTNVVIKTLIDCDFWRKWSAAGYRPASTTELASLASIDPNLLRRLLRHLSGQQLLHQDQADSDGDTFVPTDFSRALAGPDFPYIWTMMYEMHQPCYANFPAFLAETQYQNPTDSARTNFSHWYGPGKTVFDLCRERPLVGQAFDHMLAAYAQARTPWVDVYPTERVVERAQDRAGGVLFVDIGGGLGHDTEMLRARHPEVPAGSLVLQDLPNVLERATVHGPAVVKQASDIFAPPQPERGARVYFLHTVLHNWADQQAVQALRNIAAAMEAGYSRILIYEIVIRKRESHPRAMTSDLAMMLAFSSKERDEETWDKIAAEAGLRIAKIWSVPESVECVIEMELRPRPDHA